MADLEKELELDLENLDVGDVAVSIGANLESHLLMSAFVVCSWSQVAYIANYGHRSDSSLWSSLISVHIVCFHEKFSLKCT